MEESNGVKKEKMKRLYRFNFLGKGGSNRNGGNLDVYGIYN